MAREPVRERRAGVGFELGSHVFIKIIGFKIVQKPRRTDVEAAVICLARPIVVALTEGLVRVGIVLVKEAHEIAHVEIRAPLLGGFGLRAAHPDGDYYFGFAVVGHSLVAYRDFADIVVAIMIESVVDNVLKAENGHERGAVELNARAAFPTLIIIEPYIGGRGILRFGIVVRQRGSYRRKARKLGVINGVVPKEIAEVHRERNRGGLVFMAAAELPRENVAAGIRIVSVGDAVIIRIGLAGIL